MKNMISAVLITGLASAAITSCTKEPLNNINEEESRIYTVSYDSAINFSDYKTYSIADSAVVIDNGAFTKELTATDAAYIAAVDVMMQQRGYTKVSNTGDPDIAINVNRVYNTSTGLIDYSGYWDYYGGYWDPGYWGYSGYDYYVPYAYGVYQVTEGLMSVDMFDLKNATGGKIDLIWNGLARGEGVFNPAVATTAVQSLFDQSQFLKSIQ